MKIKNIKIDDLVCYENNAKLHDEAHIKQIAKSITDFGFNDPIAVDENNMIIEGHGRALAAKELGMETVPCITLTGLTDVQKKSYILAHNKLCLNTGFDPLLLTNELDFLSEQGYDFSYMEFQEYSLFEASPDCTFDPDVSQIEETSEQGRIVIKIKVPVGKKSEITDALISCLAESELGDYVEWL